MLPDVLSGVMPDGESDTAWYRDLTVLARRPVEFWPNQVQTEDERLNSLVRLLAYVTLAVYMYRRDLKFLSFGVGAVAFLSLVHRFGNGPSRCAGTGAAAATVSKRSAACGRRSGREATRTPPEATCTRSTPNNPFANLLVSDLATNPGRAPACNYDAHKDEIERNFNKGLVRNMYDVYDKENSQRQFMTMPVTTAAPDTAAFARFAYGNVGRTTCKEDPSRCTGRLP